MWGASFNDLAKKAAEMQEQAASSISSPATPSFSMGGMGGMFNMDILQQEDETNPDKKGDDLKKLAQQAMSEAKSGAVNSSSATFYNPQQQQQQQQQQQHQKPAKKVHQPQQNPQSFMSNTSMNMNMNANKGMPSMALITPNAQKANATSLSKSSSLSFGTTMATPGGSTTKNPAKKLFPASLATPKGKLSLPIKTRAVPIMANNNNTNTKASIAIGSMKLKTMPPASPLIQTPAKANTNNNNNNNNNTLRGTKQGGGLVIGKNQNLPKTGSATIPKAVVKNTQVTGPTLTASKLMAPKPIPKQQNGASKKLSNDLSKAKKAEPKPANQQQPSTSASVSTTMAQSKDGPMLQTATGIPKAKPKQRQDPKTQQQSTTAQTKTPIPATLSSPPVTNTTNTTVPKKVPEAARIIPANKPVPASSPAEIEAALGTTPTVPNTSAAAEKEANQAPSGNDSIVSKAGTKDPTPVRDVSNETKEGLLPAAASEDKGALGEQLQQQQEEFKTNLEEQRQQMEGRMQGLQQQFSEQLQRLENHHRHETENFNARLEASTAHWQQQVRDRDILLKSQSQTAESNKKQSQTMLTKLSSDLNQARELLTDKEKEDRNLQEAHLQQLRQMEKQCNRKEDTSNNLGQEIQNLEKKLEESKKETQTAIGDYSNLKERAKIVAGELKERRAECRTSSSEIDILNGAKISLQERITQLEASGMDMNQSSEETQAKLNSLQSSLDKTKKEVDEVRATLEEEKKKGEKSLSNYKKKAQQSLAVANARSASAVHSREEAEMEARAARATADTAMERAMKSELNGRQALAEAKVYVEEMKGEVAKYESVKSKGEETSRELKQTQTEAEAHKDSNEKLRCELTSLSGRLEAEQATVVDLKQSFTSAQNRSNELYDEVERLRRESRRHQDEIKRVSEANKNTDSSFTSEEEAAAIVRGVNAEAEATIAMLQQELQASNQAIKDLKETLKATMEEKDSLGDGVYPNTNGTMNGNNRQPESNGMPLFYAMEKQAELTQARDEITRMANLLGDAESTKQDALDEMQTMKRLMEDTRSKLQRQEQLQTKSPGEETSLNLEYLKNIMLSYLNAATIQEKKALLPVIGTVLCLTQEEQTKAIDQLDKGSGSMIDSVTTSVLGLKW